MRLHRYNLHVQKSAVDTILLSTIVVLVLFGMIMVYDSSVFQALHDFNDSYYYIRQQVLWVLLGISTATFCYFFNYHNWKRFATPMMVGAVLLMLAVFIPGLGVSGGGAHRWLRFGFITIQPTEIIKLASAIYLAAIFEKKVYMIFFISVLSVVSVITAVLQKDLGSTIVFVLMSLVIYFSAGGSVKYLLGLIITGVVAFWVAVVTSSYRMKRITAFLDPFSDTSGFTYHISQVLIALGSGGIFGLGFGQSRQKFEYIPEVSTDSIFAIVGEELGFVGGVTLIILFGLLVYRGIKIAQNTHDQFGKILALGLTTWLGVQAIINLSAMVALLPLTGVPLPFISYGGSALVANLTAIGILLNISKQNSLSV